MPYAFNPFTGRLDYYAASLTTPVSIANGGTGQATATLAFNALSPLSARGDLLTRDATNNIRLAPGTAGQFLQTAGAGADAGWVATSMGVLTMSGGAATGWAPAANTTYYFTGNLTANPSTVEANVGGVSLPVTATLRAATFLSQVFGTKATAGQNVTVSVHYNHASDLSIGAGDWSGLNNTLAVTGLSQAFSTTDTYSIKMITPAVWTTLPTTVFVQAMLYFDRP